jgi:protein-disulfide isomerase
MPLGTDGDHLFVIRARTNNAVSRPNELCEVGPCGSEALQRGTVRYVLARITILALVVAGAVLAWGGRGWAGEQQVEWTRADLVAALERGPGPSKGSAAASVVLVYFTDFQCGYCRKFVKETLPKIDEQYIRTGKVRLTFRHMAILGEASVQAARAASCASDQGKFWEYHDALFANTSPLAFNAARLKRYASDLRLDEPTFATCLNSTVHAKQVETETLIGRALGATGTPAFLLNGQLLLGAYPFEVFQRGLDNLLAPAPRAAPPQPRQ